MNDIPQLHSLSQELIADRLRTLRSLQITNQPELTDDSFEELLSLCPKLETIEVQNCPLLGDRTLSTLAKKNPYLRTLFWVGNPSTTPEGYNEFSLRFPTLETLNLSGTPLPSSVCNSLISQSNQLRALDVSFCPLDDNAFESPRSPLCFLNLQGCSDITDKTLFELSKVPTLRHLFLAYNDQITPAGIAHLQSLRLQTLHISHCANLCP